MNRVVLHAGLPARAHRVVLGISMALASAALVANAPAGDSSDTASARIARVEHGIEPLHMGAGQPSVALDLKQLMKLNDDPGLSVAVIDGYRIVWTKAYGTTDAGGRTPVTTTTLFQAGSISKPVAATGMMALVEQGRLSLDEDVNAKLKSWKVPENTFTTVQKVTLRRLASHTAGLTVEGFPGYDVDAQVPTLVQILNGEPPANTPAIRVDFVPGSKSRYSGGGVTIEQQLMVDVSGQAFPDLMKITVLKKIGMDDSTYLQPPPASWAARTASGTYANGKSVHGKWHIYPQMAAAGLWTTPTDLAKFAIETALSEHGKSNKVLTQKTTQEMLTAQPATDGEIALGFFVSAQHPGEFSHNGDNEGFQALLVMNAANGQGAVLMANSDNGFAVMSEYLRSIAQEYQWTNWRAGRSPGKRIVLVARMDGVDAALHLYDELKTDADQKQQPDEHVLDVLGNKLLQAGATDGAITALEKNTTEFPDSTDAYASLGSAYSAAGKKEQAIACLQKALKLDPGNQDARDLLKKLTGDTEGQRSPAVH